MACAAGFLAGLLTGILLVCLLQIRQCEKKDDKSTIEDDGISEKREM